jgi:hypothetical protein
MMDAPPLPRLVVSLVDARGAAHLQPPQVCPAAHVIIFVTFPNLS